MLMFNMLRQTSQKVDAIAERQKSMEEESNRVSSILLAEKTGASAQEQVALMAGEAESLQDRINELERALEKAESEGQPMLSPREMEELHEKTEAAHRNLNRLMHTAAESLNVG